SPQPWGPGWRVKFRWDFRLFNPKGIAKQSPGLRAASNLGYPVKWKLPGSNPKGIVSSSPGLRATRNPGDPVKMNTTPTGLCLNPRHSFHRMRFHVSATARATRPETSASDDVPPGLQCIASPVQG